MKYLLLFLLVLMPLPAQVNGIDQNLEFLVNPLHNGTNFLRWHGKTGRTYFIQVSSPANPLKTWTYAPVAEVGNDEDISYEVGSLAQSAFFRLEYTDDVISPIDSTYGPLEVVATSASSNLQEATQPIILYLNETIPEGFTVNNSWVFDVSSGSAVPVSGTTVILSGRQAIAFIPAGNSLNQTPGWAYQINFTGAHTGLPNLLPFQLAFTTITAAAGASGSGPYFSYPSPADNNINVAPDVVITAQCSEPLSPNTLIPANVSLVPDGGTPVAVTVAFDYGKDVNLLKITPTQPLTRGTKYTVTLGAAFTNLSAIPHAQPMSWSFTTQPLRPTPIPGGGPYVTVTTPQDFAFEINPPQSISVTFSEDMDPSTLTTNTVHIRAGINPDMPGTFSYDSASKTLAFLPANPIPPSTYLSIALDNNRIFNNATQDSGNRMALQANNTFVSSTTGLADLFGTGLGGGTPVPGALTPINLLYSWGYFCSPTSTLPSGPGCSVTITYTSKDGQSRVTTLPYSQTPQSRYSGPLPTGTTIKVTPKYYNNNTSDSEDTLYKEQTGVNVWGTSPDTMYLAIVNDSEQPPEVNAILGCIDYMGNTYMATCSSPYRNDALDTLYLVPVPIERTIDGESTSKFLEGPAAMALPGQKISLKVNDDYLKKYGPKGVTLNNVSWYDVGGDSFKEYLPDTKNSNLSFLDYWAGDYFDKEIKFYWAQSGQRWVEAYFDVTAASSGYSSYAAGIILVDQPISQFNLTIGRERLATDAPENPDGTGDLIWMFGLFPKNLNKVSPGVKFDGFVDTSSYWSQKGKWAYVQLIQSQRNYTYINGITSHNGDGTSIKLDTSFPYQGPFAADGTSPALICGDTPRDALFGFPPPQGNPPVPVPRLSISAHDTFWTYLMFVPPGSNSRPVPLQLASWQWGGVGTINNNWTPPDGTTYSTSSNTIGYDWTIYPEWKSNTTSDKETFP